MKRLMEQFDSFLELETSEVIVITIFMVITVFGLFAAAEFVFTLPIVQEWLKAWPTNGSVLLMFMIHLYMVLRVKQ